MAKDEKLTAAEAIRKAKLQMLEFYDSLEKRVKRHSPQEYIPYCAQRLYEYQRALNSRRIIPPHNLLNSIEANCAFYKDGYSEQVSWNKFARIMNLYQQYEDPFLSYTISENLDRFFLMMARQQFELQNTPSKSYMARVWSLFVDNPHTVSLGERFKDAYGFTFEQWFHLCFLLWGVAHQQPNRMFRKDILLGCDFYEITPQLAESFYSHISLSVEQIKENYNTIRSQEEHAFHFLIRSVFLQRPIIDFQNGNMIAPHPDLVFLRAGEGLLELTSSISGAEQLLARSFEKYIERLLNCLDDRTKIISSSQLEDIVRNSTGGNSCDYLIETSTEIIMVECKAITFTAKMLTDNAILNNNSTGKIAKALVQIYTTAYDLHNGVFDCLELGHGKPVIGLVITMGEIPLVNSEWYFNNFIMARADNKLSNPIFPSKRMAHQPVSLSVDTFEILITIMNNTKKSLMDLTEYKNEKSYAEVGEWNTYLQSMLKSEYEVLPIVRDNNKSFFESMGIDMNQLENESS